MKAQLEKNREGQVDIRDDEEQQIKLSEIIQLLVAAGYFRARIKGLSPFDKIVGGMTWCIQICNFDVDVDLLFNENSTIGQKISLTEHIVTVLPQMKCPYLIEPHQIQGLDAIHIFPVIQWLVKKALETKAEYDDDNRRYSVSEYHRHYTTPLDQEVTLNYDDSFKSINQAKSIFGPKRKLKRKPGVTVPSVREQTQLTLLEYGSNTLSSVQSSTAGKDNDNDQPDGTEEEEMTEMMNKLDVSDASQEKLSASHVRSIVSGGAKEIMQASQRFSQLQEDIQNQAKDDTAHSQAKRLSKLEVQKEKLTMKANKLNKEYEELSNINNRNKQELAEALQTTQQLNKQLEDLKIVDNKENQKLISELSSLVQANETARKKETTFKEICRNQADDLKKQIAELEKKVEEANLSDSLAEKCEAEREKYSKMRRQLAKKTRRVEGLKRSIDDIPGRAELSQYQRRFVELYNQIAAAHRETGQFYNMYNSLADSKTYMEKELTLLNSILDNMALGSNSALEEFIHQLEVIVDGIKQNKIKLEQRRSEEKAHKAGLVSELTHLQELNRQYVTTVHLLSQEIQKNEVLQEKVNNLNV